MTGFGRFQLPSMPPGFPRGDGGWVQKGHANRDFDSATPTKRIKKKESILKFS